jgi:hypothetical protein
MSSKNYGKGYRAEYLLVKLLFKYDFLAFRMPQSKGIAEFKHHNGKKQRIGLGIDVWASKFIKTPTDFRGYTGVEEAKNGGYTKAMGFNVKNGKKPAYFDPLEVKDAIYHCLKGGGQLYFVDRYYSQGKPWETTGIVDVDGLIRTGQSYRVDETKLFPISKVM